MAIRSLIAEGVSPFVVQVGASDGITNDPLNKILKQYHLSALLVEPDPFSFDRLKATYKQHENIVFENCAVSSREGVLVLYCYSGDDDEQRIAKRQLTANRLDHLLAHGIPKDDIAEVQVPCLTLAGLLRKHKIIKIDVLQVDIEGNDDEVVLSALHLDQPPTVIHFEHKHLSFIRRDDLLCRLHARGYEFAHTGMDTLAYFGASVATDGLPCWF